MENTVNKAVTVSLMTIATLIVAAIAAKVKAALDAQAPEGYEDEGGFHFGSPRLR